MIQKIKTYASNNPLAFTLVLALFVRLIAVVFSKGWLIFDDHYLIVEVAGGWADGVDPKKWLPGTEGNSGPTYTSFFYVGAVWVFFEFLQLFGIESPEVQMFLLRFVHAIYSLLIVYFGYKIALKLSNQKTAFTVGIMLAIFGFFPVFSVKQLTEMVCIPPILGAYYFLIKGDSKNVTNYIIAGFLAGIAVGIRYQSGIIFLGIGVALLFQQKWKGLILLSSTAGVVFFLTQLPDLILWGKPFTNLNEYIFHNSTNSKGYVTSAWYTYILTLIGFLIPPVSLMLIFGFFRKFQKHLLFVLPVLLFLIFHSLYPNKQERFIITILPIVMIIGVIGWNEFKTSSNFWTKNQTLHKAFWGFFWTVNILILGFFSTSYTKRQYAESMIYMSKKDDLTKFLIENSNVPQFTMVPLYYFGDWDFQYVINKQHNILHTQENILQSREHAYPNYILFHNDTNLELRMVKAEEAFGELEFETIIEPGNYDKLLAYLNPHNKIERIHIYKIKNIPANAPE